MSGAKYVVLHQNIMMAFAYGLVNIVMDTLFDTPEKRLTW